MADQQGAALGGEGVHRFSGTGPKPTRNVTNDKSSQTRDTSPPRHEVGDGADSRRGRTSTGGIRGLGWLLCIVLVSGYIGLGSVPLTDVDEAVFSEASREMVEGGDWVTPTYNGSPRYDKPILFYWFQSVSFLVLGINEYAARFPSMLAFTLLTALLYLFSRRYLSWAASLGTTTAWILCLETFLYSRAAVTDMTVSLFIFGALASIFVYLEDTERRGWLRVAYACSALAFLTKGLIGVLFPWGIGVLYALVQKRFRIRQWWDTPGVLVFLGLAAPWYGIQTLRDGGAFLEAFFLKHHVQRYSDVVSGHQGPWFYFALVVAVGFFPWVGFVPAGMAAALRSPAERLARFASLWFVFVVLFFSFSGTKLPNYILSALPAGAILAGVGMDRLSQGASRRSVALAGGTALGIGIVLWGGAGYFWYHVERSSFPATGFGLVFGFLTIVLAWTLFVIGKKRVFAHWIPAVSMAGILLASAWLILPPVSEILQGDLKRHAEAAGIRNSSVPGGLVAFDMNKPSLSFYYRGPVEKIRDLELLKTKIAVNPSLLVVASSRPEIVAAMREAGLRVYRHGKWLHLFEVVPGS